MCLSVPVSLHPHFITSNRARIFTLDVIQIGRIQIFSFRGIRRKFVFSSCRSLLYIIFVQLWSLRCRKLELCAYCILLGATPWRHAISDFLKGFLSCQSCPQWCWYSLFLFLAYSHHLRRCGAMIRRRSWQQTEASSERPSSEQPTELVLLIQNSRQKMCLCFQFEKYEWQLIRCIVILQGYVVMLQGYVVMLEESWFVSQQRQEIVFPPLALL